MKMYRGIAQDVMALSLGGALLFFAFGGQIAEAGRSSGESHAALAAADKAPRLALAAVDEDRPALRLTLRGDDPADRSYR